MPFSKTRREGILVEPYKQLRFGITFLVINLVFSTLLLTIFGYYVWDIYDTVSVYFELDGKENLLMLSKLAMPLAFATVLVILFIITTLVASARYTHQIYGPLVSIRRFLDDLNEGKVPSKINLRATDQLQDLATTLNQLILNKTFIKAESKAKLSDFVEKLSENEKPSPLALESNDALYDLGTKLNKLLHP